jgi:hypothetical protein
MTMKSSIKLQLSLLEFLSLLGRIPALLGDLQRSEYNQVRIMFEPGLPLLPS